MGAVDGRLEGLTDGARVIDLEIERDTVALSDAVIDACIDRVLLLLAAPAVGDSGGSPLAETLLVSDGGFDSLRLLLGVALALLATLLLPLGDGAGEGVIGARTSTLWPAVTARDGLPATFIGSESSSARPPTGAARPL